MRRAVAVCAGAAWLAAASGARAGLPGSRAAFDPAAAGTALVHDVRALDGDQLLADAPLWMCGDPAGGPAVEDAGLWHDFGLVGRLPNGGIVRRGEVAGPASGAMSGRSAGDAARAPRAGEFSATFAFHDPGGRHPLLGQFTGLPEGEWEVRGQGADSARVLARFRVVEPRGAERFVRDGLARAARLSAGGGEGPGALQAARLYDAILRRYPRTTYLSVIYLGLWRVRGHTRFAGDPDRWLEEIFARFHDGCFGTVALDQWVRDMGEARARPTVARLVGLYPDTPLARAAQRYLR